MNFYKHYIGDFQRDTGHLSLTERGAYRALLDAFYASEKPLPTGTGELCRLVGAFDEIEREAVTRVLNEFWTRTDEGWVNNRALKEIAKADHQRDVNRVIAEQREARRRELRSHNGSSHEPSTNRATNDQPIQTPDTRHQTKSQRHASRASPRGTRLPTDWGLGEEARAFAKGLGLDPDFVLAKFRDYWQAQPGAKGVKVDWDATWRNWCRTEAERGNGTANKFHVKPSGDAERAWSDLIASDGAKRDAKVQAAIEAVGGWLAIKARTPFNETKLRAEFCRAYSEAA